MSLQNIFTMIKADRYTEDGCGELNKVRKEIEDARRTYKPGEISEKTGLQKQSNGTWAPPKKGGTQGAGEKKTEGKKINYQVTEKGGKYYATGHQFSDGSQLYAGPFGSEKAVHEFMNNTPYKAAESKPAESKASKTTSQEESRVDLWLKEDPSKLSDEELMGKNETLHDLSKSANGEDFKKIMNAGIAIEEELTKRKLPTNPGGIGYEEAKKSAIQKDAVPRALTGDCRIRVRK